VTVTASAGGARLDAWIDFNSNGTFEAGERIANSLALGAGPNNVAFNVPGAAVLGSTGARFRISTAGGLAPTGLAANGEVEDYIVSIVTLEAFCGLAPPPGAIVGTAGPDDLVGTAGNDVIFGLAGNDRLQGLGGNDILCGGNDVDHLIGGDGDDSLVGGPGVDRLEGGEGNDTLLGGPGTDRLDGGPGTNVNDGGPDVNQCFNPSSGPGCP
jgi:Ca2+-binding RTX toxin-like protein